MASNGNLHEPRVPQRAGPAWILIMKGEVVLVLVTVAACLDWKQTGMPAASNHLAIRLLHALPKRSNMFYSPYSILAAMTMAYAGANGNTREELYYALGYRWAHIPRDKVLHEQSDYLQRLLARSNSTLNIANAAAIQQRFDVLPAFTNTLKKMFGNHVIALDFGGKPAKAAEDINKWVEHQTNGHITNLFGRTIPANTKLMLLNCVYFKGVWMTKFRNAGTKRRPFYNRGSRWTVVETMVGQVKASHGASEELDAEILDLPYQGGDYTMTIILPRDKEGIDKLNNLSLHALDVALGHLKEGVVTVYLPRFKVDSMVHLKKELGILGLKSIFDPHKADLSGITDHEGLHVDDVVHKVVIEVDENGSTAAAVTGTTLHKSVHVPRIIRVDHPFMFLIRRRKDGTILFVGKVEALYSDALPSSNDDSHLVQFRRNRKYQKYRKLQKHRNT
ncbi:iripin-2-like [Amblyomma americanum]